MKAAICAHCGSECRLTNGKEIYPHRSDLHALFFWKCDPCSAYVGCHKAGMSDNNPEGKKPLGTAADAELRRLRQQVHSTVDPIWQNAKHRGRARQAVYKALTNIGHRLGFVDIGTSFHSSHLSVSQAHSFLLAREQIVKQLRATTRL